MQITLVDSDLMGGSTPSVEVFSASDGSLYLLRPAAEDLMIRHPPAGTRRLLERLDGGRTCEQLAGDDGVEAPRRVRQDDLERPLHDRSEVGVSRRLRAVSGSRHEPSC